jgi:hypothetical protein
VNTNGESAVCTTTVGLVLWTWPQTLKSMRPLPFVSNSAHASPVEPLPVHWFVASQLQKGL